MNGPQIAWQSESPTRHAHRAPLAWRLLVTCEHGGNRIPPAYRQYFADCDDLLQSHRGYDAGALDMAQRLAAAFDAPLVASTTSRLLVDLNRSLGHRALHLPALFNVPAALRQCIVAHHYHPFRNQAQTMIGNWLDAHCGVIHISSHSFTPELHGSVRRADVGLLYDPARAREAALCHAWQVQMGRLAPAWRVRRNYPYRGTADGFTTFLRRLFPRSPYLGIELEINQRHVAADGDERSGWDCLQQALIEGLRAAMNELGLPLAGEARRRAAARMETY